jgi:hypothetical protein
MLVLCELDSKLFKSIDMLKFAELQARDAKLRDIYPKSLLNCS